MTGSEIPNVGGRSGCDKCRRGAIRNDAYRVSVSRVEQRKSEVHQTKSDGLHPLDWQMTAF